MFNYYSHKKYLELQEGRETEKQKEKTEKELKKKKNEQLVKNYDKRVENFIFSMANKPIVIKDTCVSQINPRFEFLKQNDHKKPFVFTSFAMDKTHRKDLNEIDKGSLAKAKSPNPSNTADNFNSNKNMKMSAKSMILTTNKFRTKLSDELPDKSNKLSVRNYENNGLFSYKSLRKKYTMKNAKSNKHREFNCTYRNNFHDSFKNLIETDSDNNSDYMYQEEKNKENSKTNFKDYLTLHKSMSSKYLTKYYYLKNLSNDQNKKILLNLKNFNISKDNKKHPNENRISLGELGDNTRSYSNKTHFKATSEIVNSANVDIKTRNHKRNESTNFSIPKIEEKNFNKRELFNSINHNENKSALESQIKLEYSQNSTNNVNINYLDQFNQDISNGYRKLKYSSLKGELLDSALKRKFENDLNLNVEIFNTNTKKFSESKMFMIKFSDYEKNFDVIQTNPLLYNLNINKLKIEEINPSNFDCCDLDYLKDLIEKRNQEELIAAERKTIKFINKPIDGKYKQINPGSINNGDVNILIDEEEFTWPHKTKMKKSDFNLLAQKVLKKCNFVHEKNKNNRSALKKGEGKVMITSGMSLKEFTQKFSLPI